MPDRHPFEDEATLYVLGRLTGDERREFEARLAQSTELRALVRELEDGAVALAMAAPQRRPPPQVWQRIESAVGKETEPNARALSFWARWWRSGWAAAATCVIGWLLYAIWNHGAGSRIASQPPAVEEGARSVEAKPPTMRDGNANASPRLATTNVVPSPSSDSLAKAGQIAVLRRQVAELEAQIAQMSNAFSQRQTIWSNSSQLTFFNLTPPGTDGASRTAKLSPELQHALLMALARELGLLQAFGPTNNRTRVEFVTLPRATHDNTTQPATDGTTARTEPAEPSTDGNVSTTTPPESVQPSLDASTTGSASTAVAGFVSGTNAVVAVDPSSNPSLYGPLTIWTATANGGYLGLGTFSAGNSPVVATIPMGNLFSGGLNLTVTAGTAANWVTPSNTIGQFPPPSAGSP